MSETGPSQAPPCSKCQEGEMEQSLSGLQKAATELVAEGWCYQEDGSSVCCSPVLPTRRQQFPSWLEISLHRMPVQLHPKQPTVGLHWMKPECCNTTNQHQHSLLVSPTSKFQRNLLSSIFKEILLGLGQVLRLFPYQLSRWGVTYAVTHQRQGTALIKLTISQATNMTNTTPSSSVLWLKDKLWC